jgi:hypothetical protein
VPPAPGGLHYRPVTKYFSAASMRNLYANCVSWMYQPTVTMKITSLLLCLLLAVGSACHAQENPAYNFNPDTLLKKRKTTSVLFADLNMGVAGGSSNGLFLGSSLNYQLGRHFITARYNILEDRQRINSTAGFIFLPRTRVTETIEEGALLYGRFYAKGDTHYSFSGGLSFVHRVRYEYTDAARIRHNTLGAGFPFELSIKWFKKEKRPYHVYYVIPIGKPTGLGNSFGFKIIGNVASTTFIGIGLSFGLGWHKHYY